MVDKIFHSWPFFDPPLRELAKSLDAWLSGAVAAEFDKQRARSW